MIACSNLFRGYNTEKGNLTEVIKMVLRKEEHPTVVRVFLFYYVQERRVGQSFVNYITSIMTHGRIGVIVVTD